MPRSRVITVVVMASALLAALVFGAAAVLGWALARPIGVVAGLAALTNIGLISSPRSALGRRLALVFGASMLVASVGVGAWGFITGVPWWLSLMPIVGALLMVPEVLDLITFPGAAKPSRTPDELAERPEPAPTEVRIELETEAAQHAFFAGPNTDTAPTAPTPDTADLLPGDPGIVPIPQRSDLLATAPQLEDDSVEDAAEPVEEPADSPVEEPVPEQVEVAEVAEPPAEHEEPAEPDAEAPVTDEPSAGSDYDDIVDTAARGIPVVWDDAEDDHDEVEITGRHAIIEPGPADDDAEDDFDDVVDTAARGIPVVWDDDEDDDDVVVTGRHGFSLDDLFADEDEPPTPRRGRRAL